MESSFPCDVSTLWMPRDDWAVVALMSRLAAGSSELKSLQLVAGLSRAYVLAPKAQSETLSKALGALRRSIDEASESALAAAHGSVARHALDAPVNRGLRLAQGRLRQWGHESEPVKTRLDNWVEKVSLSLSGGAPGMQPGVDPKPHGEYSSSDPMAHSEALESGTPIRLHVLFHGRTTCTQCFRDALARSVSRQAGSPRWRARDTSGLCYGYFSTPVVGATGVSLLITVTTLGGREDAITEQLFRGVNGLSDLPGISLDDLYDRTVLFRASDAMGALREGLSPALNDLAYLDLYLQDLANGHSPTCRSGGAPRVDLATRWWEPYA